MTGDSGARSGSAPLLLGSGVGLVGLALFWLVLPGLRRRGAHS
jgi:hypothetical protein